MYSLIIGIVIRVMWHDRDYQGLWLCAFADFVVDRLVLSLAFVLILRLTPVQHDQSFDDQLASHLLLSSLVGKAIVSRWRIFEACKIVYLTYRALLVVILCLHLRPCLSTTNLEH